MASDESPHEAMSEFGRYTGDCVWNAVQVAFHFLAPLRYPLTIAAENTRTQEAIAAGIGVGNEGQADPSQLEHMLGVWGARYTRAYAYNGVTIPTAQLQTILSGALARRKPVLLGFTNGQALTGDEHGLQGHEIAVLHGSPSGLYLCGDGDNPACTSGFCVDYSLAILESAAPDSAYVIEEVPGMVLQIADTGGKYVDKTGFPLDTVWSCVVAGHQFDVQHGTLDYFRLVAPVAGVALPKENLRYLGNDEYEQTFDLYTIHWTPSAGGYLVPATGLGAVYLHAGPASLVNDGSTLHVGIPYTISGQP